MFRIGRRRDDPTDLRQFALLHVGAESGQHGVQVVAVGGRQGVAVAFVQRRGRVELVAIRHEGVEVFWRPSRVAHLNAGGAVLAKARQRVVGKVVRQELVHLPTDAARLQPFRIGGPPVADLCRAGAVPFVDHYRHVGGGRAVGAGPVEQPIGVGAGVDGAVIGIAQGEGVGQRELERQLLLAVVAHRGRRFVGGPGAHAAVIPGGLLIHPRVRRAGDALGVAAFAVQMVGQHQPFGALLLPDQAIAGQWNGKSIAEAAHARQGAEVVIERAVLLHQDHHVFDVAQGAGAVIGGNGQRFANRGGQQRERRSDGGSPQDVSARKVRHASLISVSVL